MTGARRRALGRRFRGARPADALVPFGVAGTLPDPQLQLYSGTTVPESNNAWAGNAQISQTAASVGAFAWTWARATTRRFSSPCRPAPTPPRCRARAATRASRWSKSMKCRNPGLRAMSRGCFQWTLALLLLGAASSTWAADLAWERGWIQVSAPPGRRVVNVAFPFRNTGNRTIKLVSIEASCRCLAASSSQKSYGPGARGDIRVPAFTLSRREPRGGPGFGTSPRSSPGPASPHGSRPT